MKEQVIFPEPQDVTILATRKGELTQIPGLEFRAPVVPYETDISVGWSSWYGYLKITHSEEVTVKVHALGQKASYGGLIYYAMPSEKTYSYLGGTYVYWKAHTDNEWGGKPNADPDDPLIILAEIVGYKAVETISLPETYTPQKLYLPESYGVMARLEVVNPQWGEDKWDW